MTTKEIRVRNAQRIVDEMTFKQMLASYELLSAKIDLLLAPVELPKIILIEEPEVVPLDALPPLPFGADTEEYVGELGIVASCELRVADLLEKIDELNRQVLMIKQYEFNVYVTSESCLEWSFSMGSFDYDCDDHRSPLEQEQDVMNSITREFGVDYYQNWTETCRFTGYTYSRSWNDLDQKRKMFEVALRRKLRRMYNGLLESKEKTSEKSLDHQFPFCMGCGELEAECFCEEIYKDFDGEEVRF